MKVTKNNFFCGVGVITNQWKQFASEQGLPWKDSFIKWELPPSVDADFTVVIALQVAKKLGKNPYQLASQLGRDLPPSYSFEVTVTEEGYLNCYIKDCFCQSYLVAVSNKCLVSNYQQNNLTRINIEFVSVNPTGYLHLGHLRNAVIGDVLARVYSFLGYQVIREYYINDRGSQIDELIKSVLFYRGQLEGRNADFSEESLLYKGPATRAAAL